MQPDRSCACAEGQCEAKDKYLDQLEEVLIHSVSGGRPAAFFAESIQGVGGAVQFPKVRSSRKKYAALITILSEGITSFRVVLKL